MFWFPGDITYEFVSLLFPRVDIFLENNNITISTYKQVYLCKWFIYELSSILCEERKLKIKFHEDIVGFVYSRLVVPGTRVNIHTFIYAALLL